MRDPVSKVGLVMPRWGLKRWITARSVLLLFPLVALALLLSGEEKPLILVIVGLPLLAAAFGAVRVKDAAPLGWQDNRSPRHILTALLETGLRDRGLAHPSTACLVFRMDDALRFRDHHGTMTEAEVLSRCDNRLQASLRDGDIVIRLAEGGFAIGLRAGRRLDLEAAIQMAARLQATLAVGLSVDACIHYVSFSVGFCLGGRAPFPTGEALLASADMAAWDALTNGPGAIRAFTPDLAKRQSGRIDLRDALEIALANGEIRAHFQPQVSTDTGHISGFEALARWHHPERGVISPCDFLPLIDAAGLSERLAEVMVVHSMTALVAWDRAGFVVPTVGVNFSTADLRNPNLCEKLKWELDRFGLTPDRLSVEILETVVANTDSDISVRNIAALAALGCGIDLDDFGTGNASIGSIRRFAVRRIKIDRSFVSHVDNDRDQQRMISALVSLADRLGLETLAEGVETGGEHAMLAQLGCRHVQGFGIARPMPFDDTLSWMSAHQAATIIPPRIGKRTAHP